MRSFFGRSIALSSIFLLTQGAFAQTGINTQTASTSQVSSANRGCGTPSLPAQFETWLQGLPQSKPGKLGGGQTQSVFNIPVIVHIVHNNETLNSPSATSGGNLNSAQIYDQINILNRDFNAKNADTSLVPTVFKPYIGNFQFNFCLAVVNPTGGILAEPGIDRINRVSKSWSGPPYTQTYITGTIKPNSIWDPTKYLNMWVLDLGSGLLGYATFPNPGSSGLGGFSPPYGSATTDGLVMDNEAFGSVGTAVSNNPYHLGRTAVHELGHWLGLRHIWGDGTCATDYCADTPPAQGPNYGCSTHPFNVGGCSGNTTGEMFMNYMDYGDDNCMRLFTHDQKNRAQLIMTFSSMRASLLTSTVCNLPSATNEIGLLYVVSPTYSQVVNCNNVITPSVIVHNFATNTVTSATFSFNVNGVGTQTVPWTGTLLPGASATVSLPQVTGLANGSHTYNVGVYLPNGAPDTYTTNNFNAQQFSIVGSFSMAIAGNTLTCAGAPLTLTAQAAASAFTWNPGAQSGSVATFTPLANTVYTLTAFNGTCAGSRTLAVNMLPSPTVSLNSPSICAGGTTALAPTGACTYTWFPGSVNSPTLSVSPTSTTQYTLVASGCNGCSVTKVSTVTVVQNPVVSVLVAPAGSLCAGGSATLTASGATSYSWNTGPTAPAIIVTPGTNTTYTVTGTTGSCSTETTAVIYVGSSSLSILVTPNPATVCAGGSLTLAATGANSYTWNTGSNSTSLALTPVISADYTVNGTNGACTASSVVQVSVIPYPVISINPTPAGPICAGTNVQLTASGAGSYTWNTAQTGPVINAAPIFSTTYGVAGSNQGCVSVQTITVAISGSTLNLTAGAVPGSICPGGSVTLSASGVHNYTWTGSANPGSAVVSPTATTVYTLNGFDGPCPAYTTIQVPVIPAPLIVVSGNTGSVCAGEDVSMSVSGPYSFYTWEPGSATGSTFVATPSSSGTYTVFGQGAPGGCSTSTVFNIVVGVAPAAIINTSNTPCGEPCEGAIDASAFNGTPPYVMSIVGGTCTLPPCYNLCPGLYTLHTTDAAGCVTTDFFSIECYVKEALSENKTGALRIYPNPASDKLNIEVDGLFDYIIYNEIGQAVRHKAACVNAEEVHMEELADGIYLVVVKNGHRLLTAKLVRE